MKPILAALLCISSWISYAACQTPILTPSTLSVASKVKATFTCDVGVKNAHHTCFLKHNPGEPPKSIVCHHSSFTSPKYGPGMSSEHYDFTMNSAWTVYTLSIKESYIEDTALYYCVKYYDSAAWVFSERSKLIVTVDKFSPPVLNVFKPFSEELSTKDKLMMTCHATKLTVSLANVSWQVDGTTVQEGVSTSQPVREPDNTFSLSSYMTISPDDLSKDKVISCWVQQEGSSAFTSQGVRLSQC